MSKNRQPFFTARERLGLIVMLVIAMAILVCKFPPGRLGGNSDAPIQYPAGMESTLSVDSDSTMNVQTVGGTGREKKRSVKSAKKSRFKSRPQSPERRDPLDDVIH